jgi:hypothetical protein
MAAQCEELAHRTVELEEFNALKTLAIKCRLVCEEFKALAELDAARPFDPRTATEAA